MDEAEESMQVAAKVPEDLPEEEPPPPEIPAPAPSEAPPPPPPPDGLACSGARLPTRRSRLS